MTRDEWASKARGLGERAERLLDDLDRCWTWPVPDRADLAKLQALQPELRMLNEAIREWRLHEPRRRSRK